ncbi:MAG: VOC family protein [Pseudomonadales bacterium]|nr:VOC family protein [Pseudomonadales bacterium]
MKKVRGIGGIFFRCEDPEKTRDWYRNHLGFDTDEYGTNFEWRQADDGRNKGFTQWAPFQADTGYFGNENQQFMVNYRVENLDALLERLEEDGVVIVGDVMTHEYGRFVHIIDCDGRTLELWEPDDENYDKIVDGRTK